MATISLVKLACVFVATCIALGAISDTTEALISCSRVSDTLSSCIPHLKSSDPIRAVPSENCCAGVRSVKAMAQQTGEHRAVCQCMKSIAAGITGLNYDLATKLPAKCGVSMSYTFSPTTDCSNVTG